MAGMECFRHSGSLKEFPVQKSIFYILLLLLIIYPITSRSEEAAEAPAPVPPEQRLTVKDVQDTLASAEAAELSLLGLLQKQKAGEVVILDVRSKEAYAARHIRGAVNIPLTDLTEKTIAAAVPDKKTPVAVMCDFSLFPTRMLAMTIQAYPVLKAVGYEEVYRLNLWQTQTGMISVEDIEKALPFETAE